MGFLFCSESCYVVMAVLKWWRSTMVTFRLLVCKESPEGRRRGKVTFEANSSGLLRE